jgi:hypothetical protein
MGNYLESNVYYSTAKNLGENQNYNDKILIKKLEFSNILIAKSKYAKA